MTNQKIFILDGPDGCGKTNIGKELSRRLSIPYFKNQDEHRYFLKDPDYFRNAIRYVDRYFTSYLEDTGVSVILDRAWPSEFVYSQVLNRTTDFEVLRELDERHRALGTKIVIPVRSSYDNVNDDYDEINKNIQKIHQFYMEFAAWSKCDVQVLNVDDENLDREIEEILSFGEKE
jgi:thymidylate kinase